MIDLVVNDDMARILNVDIKSVQKEYLMDSLHDGILFTPNVDHLVRLQKDRDFYCAYQQANWIVCDSVILQRLSGLLKKGIVESSPGSTFFHEYCDYHRGDEDSRIFILGGKSGVPQMAQANINQRVGRNMVVGAHSPSFTFVDDEQECDGIIRMINESMASVLVVCATSPKQENWIVRYKDRLPNVRLFMALGATVDFEAGTVQRCPLFIQRMGMEWFWRFTQEPKRLFKRYFVDDMKFFWYFGKQLLGIYKNPFEKVIGNEG